MTNKITIKDNEFLRQFEAQIENELVKIEYSRQDRKIFLTKLAMSDELKKEGFAEIFIANVLEELRDGNFRVVPTHPLIAAFIRKNKRKYKEMLPVGIAI